MMKTMEIISEAVRNPRHPFRKADNQPKKAQKNRYERRKIKEYLHLGDWLAEEMAKQNLFRLFKKCLFVSLKTCSQEKSPLSLRADSKKFQLVCHGFEFVFGGDALLNFFWKTFFNLDDFGTIRANEMMVMAVIVFTDEFKSCCAVAEIKPLHDAHFFEQMHRAVNCREVTLAFGHF